MSDDQQRSLPPGPFEVLGLLSGAGRDEIERRAEALSSMLKLGVAPPEGDAVALPEGYERTSEMATEAARELRDPQRWLREVILWPEGIASDEALTLAADLLEGAAGKPAEPAGLVKQLAQEFLTDEVKQTSPTEQPEQWIERQLAPPTQPGLYLGGDPNRYRGEEDESKDR